MFFKIYTVPGFGRQRQLYHKLEDSQRLPASKKIFKQITLIYVFSTFFFVLTFIFFIFLYFNIIHIDTSVFFIFCIIFCWMIYQSSFIHHLVGGLLGCANVVVFWTMLPWTCLSWPPCDYLWGFLGVEYNILASTLILTACLGTLVVYSKGWGMAATAHRWPKYTCMHTYVLMHAMPVWLASGGPGAKTKSLSISVLGISVAFPSFISWVPERKTGFT